MAWQCVYVDCKGYFVNGRRLRECYSRTPGDAYEINEEFHANASFAR